MITKETLKQVLISIFIGACVAFLTSLAEGVIDALEGFGNNAVGGSAASLMYATRPRQI